MKSRVSLLVAAAALLAVGSLAQAAEPTSVKVTLTDQAGKDMRIILSKDKVKAGAKATIRLVLTPGEYVVFCNQAGHYKMGMEARFTVAK